MLNLTENHHTDKDRSQLTGVQEIMIYFFKFIYMKVWKKY